MANLRVFVVDDQEIVRSGLQRLLQLEPDIEVVGEASTGDEALRLIPTTRPDIILMDIKMPGLDGVATTRALKAMVPNAKILMLTVYADSYVAAAIDAGADGYLTKDISGPELIRALRLAARGEAPIHLSIPAEKLPHLTGDLQQKHDPTLTPRQLDVLRLVAQGESNAEIAQKLFLSERTVKRELSMIFETLGVNSRAEAVAYAYEHRLI